MGYWKYAFSRAHRIDNPPQGCGIAVIIGSLFGLILIITGLFISRQDA